MTTLAFLRSGLPENFTAAWITCLSVSRIMGILPLLIAVEVRQFT